MLHLRESVVGADTSVLPPEIQEVLAQEGVEDLIVETRGRSLVVNRKDISLFGEAAGSYFNFQEVTYIRQLEQNLSRRLRERGLLARYTFEDVLCHSPRMAQCLELARRIAGSDFTVLIMGESGTGKELLAQSIHNASGRAMHPFVAVNCAAVPENLLESELFGYVGGSFTGALREGREGLFEQANNGTVFLDEIGDMPPMLQAKLLRVLQERQIMRVGSNKVTQVNIRVIAATNRNLRERIRKGLFREDLYYRLNALSLLVPPLRDRPEDLFPLLAHFLEEQQTRNPAFTPEAREVLARYPWPGNIRELANVANHLTLMGDDPVTVKSLPAHLLGRTEAFEAESASLGRRCGLERARAVLEVLGRLGGPGAGRRAIHEALAEGGLPLSEGEVRGVLKVLGELELVRSRPGREGSGLTEKGIRYLNGLINGLIGQPI
jgi:transcriptional regulator with PAS, ATPase and Fis domain